jgi:uncharacterized protein (DUF433 family)
MPDRSMPNNPWFGNDHGDMIGIMSVVNIDPEILGGTPVFRGTRVPVESLFDYFKHGSTIEYFLEQFPSVKREQVDQFLDEAQSHLLQSLGAHHEAASR